MFLIRQVAELKQELKLRGLTVSGTKNDLIERLRNYQEQNGSKNCNPQSGQQTSAVSTFTPSPSTVSTSEQQTGEVGFKLALSPLTQMVPGRVMRFGSTNSSPPVSPSPSERSLAGMSPDETSCNDDMFGEMVSSPLTQLTLHPSPQHPPVSTMSQPLSQVKEEIQSSCNLARTLPASCQPSACLPSFTTETVDKDQMLQEKDKQIEELTRMLRQKQRLVETLRSQLEQGKMAGGTVSEKEVNEKTGTSPEVKLQTLQSPNLQNGLVVKVKKEVDCEEEMEGITEEAQVRKMAQPTQCSQETLLRLQQIQRLQVQQAVLQKQTVQQSQMQVQNIAESKPNPQPKKEAHALLLQQQQQLQQLIIQQTQQKQLQAQQKLAQHKLTQQKQSQQKLAQQNQLKQTQVQAQHSQQKNQLPLKQVQLQIQKPLANQSQQRRQLKAQHRQQQRQQMAAVPMQQVAQLPSSQTFQLCGSHLLTCIFFLFPLILH